MRIPAHGLRNSLWGCTNANTVTFSCCLAIHCFPSTTIESSILSSVTYMGGRTDTTDDLWARAKANGYQEGAHTEVDQVRGGGKYVSKTVKDHDRTLQRYIQ